MITSYCAENHEHIKFKWDLVKDEFIYEFVSTNIGKDLQEVSNDEDIELENSYIIQDKDKLVGYIYIKAIPEEVDTVELRYAVHPEYRRLSYGQQILEECSKYLFNFDGINSVELHIRKDNDASIGCAEKAKYKRLGENNDEYYYIYKTFKQGDNYEN